MSVALIQDELSNSQIPYGIVLTLIWLVWAYQMWAVPVLQGSEQGGRLNGRKLAPWSEVAADVPVPDDGWQNRTPELVLKNGDRRDCRW